MTPESRGKLTEQLLAHESFRSAAYQDSRGFWTIGVGRLIDARKGGGITRQEADYLLQNDIMGAMVKLDSAVPWWRTLDEVRQRVFVEMAFQLGITGLMDFGAMLAAAEAGNFTAATAEMLDSLWARQTPKRANVLAAMMKTGKDV